jgi:nucleotide-binding universal stress UspA family protein
MKLLLPVDGSPSAKNGIYKSKEAGLFNNAEVHLLTVNTTSSDIPASPYMALNMMNEITAANKQRALDVLNEAKEILSPDYHVHAEILREGDPAMEILRYAEEIQADLIIMGNRGLGRFNKILMGSVSHKVLTNSDCSVLIVKEK